MISNQYWYSWVVHVESVYRVCMTMLLFWVLYSILIGRKCEEICHKRVLWRADKLYYYLINWSNYHIETCCTSSSRICIAISFNFLLHKILWMSLQNVIYFCFVDRKWWILTCLNSCRFVSPLHLHWFFNVCCCYLQSCAPHAHRYSWYWENDKRCCLSPVKIGPNKLLLLQQNYATKLFISYYFIVNGERMREM